MIYMQNSNINYFNIPASIADETPPLPFNQTEALTWIHSHNESPLQATLIKNTSYFDHEASYYMKVSQVSLETLTECLASYLLQLEPNSSPLQRDGMGDSYLVLKRRISMQESRHTSSMHPIEITSITAATSAPHLSGDQIILRKEWICTFSTSEIEIDGGKRAFSFSLPLAYQEKRSQVNISW